MKMSVLAFVGVLFLSACSTVPDQSQTAATAATSSETADSAWTQQNGPSMVPRDGWVETVSGWYRSREACLHHRRPDAVGTPLSLAEECLEPGI